MEHSAGAAGGESAPRSARRVACLPRDIRDLRTQVLANAPRERPDLKRVIIFGAMKHSVQKLAEDPERFGYFG